MRKCFYHNKDNDGLCSGAIVKSVYPDCKMIGIDYGDLFPWNEITKKDDIIMVDFSLQPFSLMHEIYFKSKSFCWIDHHKSALDENVKHPLHDVHLSLDLAACELTWIHYYRNLPLPEGVHLVGLYDLWKHNDDPRIISFKYGLEVMADTVESAIWKQVLWGKKSDVDFVCKTGDIALTYQKRVDKWSMKYSFPLEFEGLKFICVNNPHTGSQQFDSIWDEAKYDAMMVFFFYGNQWGCHLYTTKKDVDLSVVAVKYGGGGHKNACGFQRNSLPFALPMKGR